MQKTNINKKLQLLLAVIICILGIFVFQKQLATADDTCDGLLGDEKKDCEDKVEQAEAYKKIIKIKEKQEDTIQSQLMLIDKEQARNQTALENTRKNLLTLGEQITNIQRDIKEKEDTIKYQIIVLSGLMRSYYENYQQGLLDIVLADKNFSDIFKNLDYTQQASLKIRDITEEIKKAKDILTKDYDDLEIKKEESEKTKDDLQDKNLNLQYTENKKQTLLTQTQTEKEKYQKLLDSIENEIYELEAGKSVDYSNLPQAKGGYFNYPLSIKTVSQGYGCLTYSFARLSYPSCKKGGKNGGFHNGLDFSTSGKYITVYAVRDGKVIATGNNGRYAYGKWIAIDHGDGLTTLYGHLSTQSVSKGKTIKIGDKIGVSGNTGYSTGPHLHFTVFSSSTFERVESKTVNGLMIPVGATVNPKNYL
jgi:murein DD-endopeptidase MepM/ murein hydrolase activator NlpD